MPDDLLHFISGPTPYSSWWLWTAVALILVLVGWYTAVFVLTMSGRRIRALPIVVATRRELLRRRFTHAVRAIADRHRAGDLSAQDAAAAVSRELRRFLHQATGVRAEYLHIGAIAAGELAAAAPILTDLVDAQFNADSTLDVGALSRSAEELIQKWG